MTHLPLNVVQMHFEAINWGGCCPTHPPVADLFFWQNHGFNEVLSGEKGYHQLLDRWRLAFPGGWMEIEHLSASDSRVVCEYLLRGKHSGPLCLPCGTVMPTQRQLALPICETFMVKNGRLAQIHTYFDQTTLLRQLGILPQNARQRIDPLPYTN